MKTADVARQLQIPMIRIRNLLAHQQIPPPPKDAAGNYCWGPEDIERLVKAAPARARGKLPTATAAQPSAA
jgi:hypothetical protein